MHFIDIALILILAFAAVKGFVRGFIIEVFSLLGLFIGIVGAARLTPAVTSHFFSGSSYYSLISFVMFFVVFLIITLIVNLGAKILSKTVKMIYLGMFDKVLGSIFSLFKWALMISLFIWLVDTLNISDLYKYSSESSIFSLVASIGPFVFEKFSSILPWFKDLFDVLENIDEKDKLVRVS